MTALALVCSHLYVSVELTCTFDVHARSNDRLFHRSGGAPGTSVFVKFGASALEPITERVEQDFWNLTGPIDKGTSHTSALA